MYVYEMVHTGMLVYLCGVLRCVHICSCWQACLCVQGLYLCVWDIHICSVCGCVYLHVCSYVMCVHICSYI